MLADRIKAAQVAAMKGQRPLELSVLRMLLSAINYKQIDLHRDMTDEDILAVVAAEAKKRREAIESYTKANRQDQVDKERQELDILSAYLPRQLTPEEIENEVMKIFSVNNPTDFPIAMKIIAPHLHGRADMALVAQLVKEKLGSG